MTKRFLIIGAGSIGQRHINCLLGLGEINISALRTKKGSQKSLPQNISKNITELYSFDEAQNWKPTHIIISNPTSLHLETLLRFNKGNYKILIEKPVSNSYEEYIKVKKDLKGNILDNGLAAYNLRFNSIILFVKNKIEKKEYGKLWRFDLNVGHYLPKWHPYEDYKNSYTARNELGGGALKTLSHEIDLCVFFGGKIMQLNASIKKVSDLEINVDDCVDLNFKCKNCKSVRVNLNFLNPEPCRYGLLYFDKGLLEYNYFSGEVFFTGYMDNEKKLIYSEKNHISNQYISQMKAFIQDDYTLGCTIKEGIYIDKIISTCFESSLKKKTICLD